MPKDERQVMVSVKRLLKQNKGEIEIVDANLPNESAMNLS